MKDLELESAQVRMRLHATIADSAFLLDMFGDDLARRNKYPTSLSGLEAVRFYLMQKHDWLPRDVQSMSTEELAFAVSEEIAKWKLPAKFRGVKDKRT